MKLFRHRRLRPTSKALILSGLLFVTGCAVQPPAPPTWTPVAWTALDGWEADRLNEALPALKTVCLHGLKKSSEAFFGSGKSSAKAGLVAQWTPACDSLIALADQAPTDSNGAETSSKLRALFLGAFQAWTYQDAAQPTGLFTGYYEPELLGSWQKSAQFNTPLWTRPRDMLTVELGDFLPDLRGRRLIGKAEKGAFKPYDTRAAIANGSLDATLDTGARRADPLLYVSDKIGAFFLEIQGSGSILLQDGSTVRVGYDAQNGHGYTPIGKVLLERGAIDKPVTMPKIRAWLEKNPDQAQDILNANPSVVFFKRRNEEAPLGAMGLPLVAERSLAIDPAFMPLGVPVWLSVGAPASPRLVVTMDTGGAIKGARRGDLFWGKGPEAEEAAGHMQATGTYYLILPKGVSPHGPAPAAP